VVALKLDVALTKNSERIPVNIPSGPKK